LRTGQKKRFKLLKNSNHA